MDQTPLKMLESMGVPKSDIQRRLENRITNIHISFNNHVRKIEEKLKIEIRCVENGGGNEGPIYKK